MGLQRTVQNAGQQSRARSPDCKNIFRKQAKGQAKSSFSEKRIVQREESGVYMHNLLFMMKALAWKRLHAPSDSS